MQEQGVRQDDPEYLKAHNLLSAVQRQQAFQKQRQLAQQQQQLQAQRQQQQNGSSAQEAVAPNGVNSKTYTYLSFPSSLCLPFLLYRPSQSERYLK